MFDRFNQSEYRTDLGSVLSVLELSQLPIEIKRVYWISNMTCSEPRGFHAHKKLNQIVLVLRGSVKLRLYRGLGVSEFVLKENDPLMHIPSGTWREIYCLEEGSLMMVLADAEYSEEDYIRDWNSYLHWFSEAK